jgi:N-acyl homoserine lactone hydrolase
LEGDVELLAGLACVLYPDSHTPGSQCVYADTNDGTAAIVGDIVRKVKLNVEKAISPGLFYDLEAIRRSHPRHPPAITSHSAYRPLSVNVV